MVSMTSNKMYSEVSGAQCLLGYRFVKEVFLLPLKCILLPEMLLAQNSKRRLLSDFNAPPMGFGMNFFYCFKVFFNVILVIFSLFILHPCLPLHLKI
jgi:hypothetical protein